MSRQQTSSSSPPLARQRGSNQAELLNHFEHLNRQRRACKLAERILRILLAEDDDTREIAIEIAATAVRQRNGDLPQDSTPVAAPAVAQT